MKFLIEQCNDIECIYCDGVMCDLPSLHMTGRETIHSFRYDAGAGRLECMCKEVDHES
jgi:hypothetical protein